MKMDKILKIGHRGADGYKPENTLISFQKAIDLNVDGIELDVHLSLDGELMVIHDETIDRTTNGKGYVNKMTLQELKGFRINNNQEIPKLKEVFDLVNHQCFINIELKGIGTAKPVVDLIEKYVVEKDWNYDHFLVSSFDWNMLQEVHLFNPKIKFGVLTEDTIEKALAFAKKINAFSIHPNYQLISREDVALMQENGFQVFPWTVNSTPDIQIMQTYNVNGIISDFPDEIMNQNFDIVIVGGGAAGFFTAINIVEKNPKLKVAILERGSEVLSKVRVSGGGRCNLTHACFEPNELVKFYPRGEKELRGPFHQFSSGDTIEWFRNHGIVLKVEDDGRVFPVSNSSQTVIDCFLEATQKLGITVLTQQSVQSIFKNEEFWKVETQKEQYITEKLILATGSNPKIWEMLQTFGHAIVSPVPSLFTFNIKDARIKELPGVSTHVSVKVKDTKLASTGPLLITHWGMSGPAILKLSAWGARILSEKEYQFTIFVNWLNDISTEEAEKILKELKQEHAKKAVSKKSPFEFPNRLWESLVLASRIDEETKWADLTKIQLQNLSNQLTNSSFEVNGKSTFKEEFVTAGGIDLKEINFKTMESKLHKNIYFAGEIINIDAITGGFNFQNAWTSGYILANSL